MLAILLSWPATEAGAQDSLTAFRISLGAINALAHDETGNMYAVRPDNTLIRYNEYGDSTGFYRGTLNGGITAVDATNPLRILLYHPAFNRIALLDRQLTLKSEIDLRRHRIFTPTAVATASDGAIWVYDPVNVRLVKLDEAGNELTSGTDLRQQIQFVPQASFLLERDRRLYLCDTSRGILVFDQFATYITILPFKGISSIQAFDQQLVFTMNDTLHSYHMLTGAERKLPLPRKMGKPVEARLTRNVLTVRYPDRLGFFRWPLQVKAQDR